MLKSCVGRLSSRLKRRKSWSGRRRNERREIGREWSRQLKKRNVKMKSNRNRSRLRSLKFKIKMLWQLISK